MIALRVLLALFSALAALGVAARKPDAPPSERTLVAGSVWLVLVAPVADRATNGAMPLAIGLSVSIVTLAIAAFVKTAPRDFAQNLWATLKSSIALPFRALAVEARARSLAMIALVLLLLGLWVVAFSGPHATVLGLLGLGPAARVAPPVPGAGLTALVRGIAGATIALGGYVASRRHGADRAAAIGWASVIVLAPAALQTMRLDRPVIAADALLVAAAVLAVRWPIGFFDGALAVVALAVGASFDAWAWLWMLPCLLAVATLSIAARRQMGVGRAITIVVSGVVFLGLASWAALRPPIAKLRFFSPLPYPSTLFDVPLKSEPLSPGHGFGVGFAWLLLPVALVGIAFVLADSISALVFRLRKIPAHDRKAPWEPLLVALVLVLSTLFRRTPEIALSTAAVVLASWLVRRISAPRIAEGLIGLSVLATVTFHWWYGF